MGAAPIIIKMSSKPLSLITAGLLSVLGVASVLAGSSAWDRYLEKADKLKKFRDTKGLVEKDVLAILRKEGLFDTVPATTQGDGNGSFATGFRPFRVDRYNGLWRWPLRYGIVSSEYGKRWGRRHDGIDIAAEPGDPVYAAASGEVIYSDDKLRGYGNTVIIRHDQKTTTLYAHNRKLLVKKGQRVRAGKRIAEIGSTGKSTGPHLHFELRGSKGPVNPRKILPKSRF